ncbi:hypothetical protein EVAR_27302_1 [Eumeta japonica]|uniref:Uncharacterized protein n=1 Tax=Eumeta variegata TaxID=151549 RepID=A0A4C1UCJ7_EUMVA|nr:hypothetical protein EVAR_27302_1 [Eumeta japonica]
MILVPVQLQSSSVHLKLHRQKAMSKTCFRQARGPLHREAVGGVGHRPRPRGLTPPLIRSMDNKKEEI